MPLFHYALQDGPHLDLLALGSNVVGRGATSVDNLSFIGIESPRGAVSRVQATIEIAANGDAWVSDCGSTNGTYISVRPGTGLRLERDKYYQLSDGCTLVFGDVERKFVQIHDEDLVAKLREGKSRASSATATTPLKEGRRGSGSVSAAVSQRRGNDTALTRSPSRQPPPSTTSRTTARVSSTALRDVPYLADVPPTKEAASSKRTRKDTPNDDVEPAKKAPKSGNPTASATKASPCGDGDEQRPLVVCTSGLEPEEKTRARKAAKRHGASMTENIEKATLLVVGSPSVRTPKFIIAVARCIPIVPMECLELPGTLTADVVREHIVSLKDNGRTYTSKALRTAIYRSEEKAALLNGLTFNLHGLRGKGKSVAEDVITGCGGTVTTRKADQGHPIDSEAALNELYDKILRGIRP